MKSIACIGLINPKTPANIGGAIRAAGCYGATMVAYTGRRYKKQSVLITDPQHFVKQIPLITIDDLKLIIPHGCIPVAIELNANAKSLCTYKHPRQAFYIFGAEDATLGKKVLSWCKDIVYVPTNGCMNLAATVNVLLYDRMNKMKGETNEI